MKRSMMSLVMIMLPLLAARAEPSPSEVIRIEVYGLVCDFCARGLEKTLRTLDAIDTVAVNLTEKRITITVKAGQTAPSDAMLKDLVIKAGYTPVAVTRGEAGHE